MAPHSSTLACKIPWMEELGGLQSMGSLRVGHNWATSLSLFTFMHWRRKWQPTPVFLTWESQGWGSLVSCHQWGCTESNMTEVTSQQQQQSNELWAPKPSSPFIKTTQFQLFLPGLQFHLEKKKEDAMVKTRLKTSIVCNWIRKWQPIPVVLPRESCRRRQWHSTPVLFFGKSHGRRSLVGCSPWGR